MTTKALLGILAGLIIIAAGFFFIASSAPSPANTALTQDAAIQAAIAAHPELASYQHTSLPPSSVEAQQAANGWDLGFIQRGSGVPGILDALCYHVSGTKEVNITGHYTRQSDAVVDTLVFETCTPDGTAQSPTNDDSRQYGDVTLRINQIATFPDVSIRPISIEEDSRCPIDVQCIQAGTVRLKLEVIGSAGTNESIVKLGQPFTTEGVTITLNDALPAKVSKTQLTPGDYRLTFTVVGLGTPVANDPSGKCYVGGCSAQLCTDQSDAVSTCEYTASYACYKTATCERQSDGKCGWTETPTLAACLANS